MLKDFLFASIIFICGVTVLKLLWNGICDFIQHRRNIAIIKKSMVLHKLLLGQEIIGFLKKSKASQSHIEFVDDCCEDIRKRAK